MRKQLMTGVAAAAICLGLASCSRFDYTLISEGEQAYVNYENAFIEKFGEPFQMYQMEWNIIEI